MVIVVDTPYAPPAAPVSDPVVPAGPRPRSVLVAAACLWLSAAIVVVMVGTEIGPIMTGIRTGSLPLVGLAFTLAVLGFAVGILVFIAVKLQAGRGWVRWLFVALYVLAIVVTVLGWMQAPEAYRASAPLATGAETFQFLLQTVALVFMFLRPSREWLAAHK